VKCQQWECFVLIDAITWFAGECASLYYGFHEDASFYDLLHSIRPLHAIKLLQHQSILYIPLSKQRKTPRDIGERAVGTRRGSNILASLKQALASKQLKTRTMQPWRSSVKAKLEESRVILQNKEHRTLLEEKKHKGKRPAKVNLRSKTSLCWMAFLPTALVWALTTLAIQH